MIETKHNILENITKLDSHQLFSTVNITWRRIILLGNVDDDILKSSEYDIFKMASKLFILVEYKRFKNTLQAFLCNRDFSSAVYFINSWVCSVLMSSMFIFFVLSYSTYCYGILFSIFSVHLGLATFKITFRIFVFIIHSWPPRCQEVAIDILKNGGMHFSANL